MNYFVNENIFSLNSGTEFSAVKRLELFKRNGTPAKILTKNYNPNLVIDVERVDLEMDDVLNMYNYFQEITDVPKKDVSVRYTDVIDKERYHIEGVDPNESKILYHGNLIGKALIAPATVGLVGSLEYYNEMGTTVARDVWDRRGFKSSTQYYHPDGQPGPQIFYNLAGEPKIEIARMNIGDQVQNTMFKLINYKGRDRRFNSEGQLFTFFMNELAAQEESVYINDRPSLVYDVADVQGAKGKWQFLHNAHTSNPEQLGGSKKIADYLKPLFVDRINDYDGVVVPTEEQKLEIEKFFNFKNVVTAPDTFVDPKPIKSITDRDRNKLVFVGRLSPEKQPQEAVQILANAKKKLPELHLEFYGYGDGQYVDSIKGLVERLGVKDAVHFNPYQGRKELDQKIADAAVILSVSTSEAFGMNVLQAMNAGVPVLAYDTKYGLHVLIDDGIEGKFAPLNSSSDAADQLVEMLSDQNKWEQMVSAAHAKAAKFGPEQAWKQWQDQQANLANLFVK